MFLFPTLVWIKLLHTLVWAIMATCVCGLPILAAKRRFGWALVVSIIVLTECVVLALNHFICPITNLAARYTSDRAANFDIYLPLWLAQNNQPIFGTLFIVVEVFCVWAWITKRRVRPDDLERNRREAKAHTPVA